MTEKLEELQQEIVETRAQMERKIAHLSSAIAREITDDPLEQQQATMLARVGTPIPEIALRITEAPQTVDNEQRAVGYTSVGSHAVPVAPDAAITREEVDGKKAVIGDLNALAGDALTAALLEYFSAHEDKPPDLDPTSLEQFNARMQRIADARSRVEKALREQS